MQLGQEKGKVSIATRARERKRLDRNEGERKDRNEGESKQGLANKNTGSTHYMHTRGSHKG